MTVHCPRGKVTWLATHRDFKRQNQDSDKKVTGQPGLGCGIQRAKHRPEAVDTQPTKNNRLGSPLSSGVARATCSGNKVSAFLNWRNMSKKPTNNRSLETQGTP